MPSKRPSDCFYRDTFPTIRSQATDEEIRAYIDSLQASEARLPLVAVYPGEHQRLGGYLIPNANDFVTSTGEAMLAHPGLFPNAPVDGESILRAQSRAAAWGSLRDHLIAQLRTVQACYLKEQSEAVRVCYHLLDQARHEDALPPRPGAINPFWRQDVLLKANQALSEGRRRGKRKRPEETAPPTAGAVAAPAMSPTEPSYARPTPAYAQPTAPHAQPTPSVQTKQRPARQSGRKVSVEIRARYLHFLQSKFPVPASPPPGNPSGPDRRADKTSSGKRETAALAHPRPTELSPDPAARKPVRPRAPARTPRSAPQKRSERDGMDLGGGTTIRTQDAPAVRATERTDPGNRSPLPRRAARRDSP